jgi:CRISPR-associated protein Csx3
MTQFPAVIIGGPPHSGKSVLVYSLTSGLRRRGVAHYVLRACPDGEGDFSNEADQALVRTIRRKGEFTSDFSNQVAGHLARRHLPLLVDVGGRPTEAQLDVLRHCTQAILLIGDRPDAPERYALDRESWRAMMSRVGLPIIADLRSILVGQDEVESVDPVVKGTISGLERGREIEGVIIDALLNRLELVLGYSHGDLMTIHRAMAPLDAIFVDLPTLVRQIGSEDGLWRPEQIPALRKVLPSGTPLAVYGRAPNWVYTALSLHAVPSEIHHFDARFGWLSPPQLPVGEDSNLVQQAGWRTEIVMHSHYELLELVSSSQYLDPGRPEELPLPPLSGKEGLVLSGKVPYWILLAAARQFGPGRRWLGVFQPQLAGAVVVESSDDQFPVGKVVSLLAH